MREKLKKIIKNLPDTPGVYLYFNKLGELLYVGKAKRLKRRVSSYFRPGKVHDARISSLVAEVHKIKIIKTGSEAEALIYEAGLIKDDKPKYNIDLKDDKSYPYLKLTTNEKFPRIILTRDRNDPGALYYGPYTNTTLLRQAVSFMKRVFPLRTCVKLKKKVCLEYHLEQCLGPCEGKISEEEYYMIVNQVKYFLEGRKDELIDELEKEMKMYSEKKEFEKAMYMKKNIEALTAVRDMYDENSAPSFDEVEELGNMLSLDKAPKIIECFDISNLSGGQSVGSMVRFKNGQPDKNGYRRFKIKTVKGIDDFKMIGEVVMRRYTRLLKENKTLPDLVLIDGGKGHLSSAKKEMDILNLEQVPLAAIAKEFNHLYVPERRVPFRFSPGSRVLSLIQRVRDEAHRFAITYHRKIRMKDQFATILRDIPGIGKKTEAKLLMEFGTIKRIKSAKEKDLKKAGLNQLQIQSLLKTLI